MAHSKNKILLLVEGYRTEPNIMKAYAKRLEEEFELNVVSFDTNIYVLYQNIKSLNEEMGLESTSTLDMLKSILRERERKFADNNNTDELIKIKNDLEILDQKYPYVYLLFDLEIQDNHYNNSDKKSILKEMLEYFNDETDNGLLLINYPMIESFRDYNLPILNDEYYERFISKAEVQNYKKIVGIRGNNFNLSKYSLDDFENITLQNVLKANYIVNNLKCIPTYEDFMLLLQSDSILDKQFVFIEIQNKIYILCCALFVYISFFGKKYYSKITSK